MSKETNENSPAKIQNLKSKIQNRDVSPARRAAFEILKKIEKERAFSSVVLPAAEAKLSPSDRALCHQLTLGVLRRRLYLDHIIQTFSKLKIGKFDLEILLALRVGLFQIIFLDKIPDFSAINESVNLAHLAKKRSAAGLVNALLRRAAREKDSLKFEFADEIERVSIETSHPRWLVEHWIKFFGFEATEKLVRANNETPGLSFRLTARADERTVETLRKLDLEITESSVAAGAFLVAKPNELLFAFARDGKIYFQEESSQLVGAAVNLQKDETFLDVCAAPGSKFTQIRAVLESENRDADFGNGKRIRAAGDFYERRLKFLRESARNQGLGDVDLIAYDAEKELPFAAETFDCILLDAPCSGTGTIRHNPEIRYFLTEKDFLNLQVKQLAILENASKALAPSGRLIYSTCSLEPEENEAVIEKFLAANTDFQTAAPPVSAKYLTAESFARTFPPRDGSDGFFIAVLKKK